MMSRNVKIDLEIKIFEKIFDILYEKHIKYCKDWLDNSVIKFNLKRKCICDIYDQNEGFEETFKKYIDSYFKNLEILFFDIIDDINNLNYYIRGRVKDYNSMIYKLNKKNKDNNGKFPIQKCLNDLIGFRIIDENYDNNINDIIKYLEYLKCKNKRIRHIKRDKNGYKGDHIYFLGPDNYSFPMELQIWDSKDEQKNIKLHSIYKQENCKWVKSYNSFE